MPAFSSGDARLVRACIYLLDAAWRSDSPGTLRADMGILSRLSRLSEADLQAHWDLLFEGWHLREGGRLVCPRLVEIWDRMTQHYGEVLRRMELAALVMQADAKNPSPEAFELISPPAPSKVSPTKGKRIYPADFAPNEASEDAMKRSGYIHADEREWLLQRFEDFGKAQRRMYADWQAAFRNFLGSAMTKRDFRDHFGYPPGGKPSREGTALQKLRSRSGTGQPAGRLLSDTFSQRQLGNARTMLAAAAAQRGLVDEDFGANHGPAHAGH